MNMMMMMMMLLLTMIIMDIDVNHKSNFSRRSMTARHVPPQHLYVELFDHHSLIVDDDDNYDDDGLSCQLQ